MKSFLKSLATLALASSVAWASEPLLLQWGTIDTASDAAQAESAALKAKVAKKAAAARKAGAAAESRAAYVVQFPGPVADEWRAWLESATQVRGYLPEFAYLVWATPSEMDAIAANPDVFWTGEWKKEYKTVCAETAPAKTTASAAADEARWMQVGSLLTGDDGAADLRARLEALPATVRSAFPRLDGSSAVAFLTDAQIEEVASWPDVEWIEPKLKARLFNDKAARTNMMNVTNAWKALSSGGLGLTGTNQIVAVADTGCDKGSLTDIHADFAGRVKAGYGWADPDPDDYEGGVYSASYSWADTDAHGTHVCGSVLGSGAKSSGQFRGMAYEAQLVMQGCQEDLSGLPDYTWDLLKQAYTAGARIHSDSWGFGTNYAGKYIYDAAYSDGYMWTNQNFIMVIAAGNDGIDKNKDGVIDAGSVSCPGTAKNCLCVGAAENYRSTGGYSEYGWGSAWSSDYPTDPIKSDKISQTSTPQGLAAFSGRGPTKDGRFKPDIVAPGTDVISVRSRMAQDDGWGIYTSNTNYLYEGGTSMATPLTSGALALVRQWLVDRKGINEPMAALMKALLINGARDMTPGQYGTDAYQEITARPDRSQGFGHVNLYNSLEPGSGNFLHFVTNKLTTGANFTTNINVGQANAGTYVLTLAWQDYPGTEEASKTLVNDLDLTVTSPSGTVYYPNNYGKLDHTNNVEFIEFTASETGTYSVKVNGYSVSKTSPHGGQPFALVMRGPETSTDPVPPAFSSPTSSTGGVQFKNIEFTFSSLLTAGYPSPYYHLTTTVSTNEYLFDNDTGDLLYTPQSYGTFYFTCIASNENGTATNTLSVTVAQAPAAVPANLTLSDVATTSFAASWSPASNAASYFLDVATVSGSSSPSTLVEEDFTSASGWSTTTYTGTSSLTYMTNNDDEVWGYQVVMVTPGGTANGAGSVGLVQMQASNGKLYLPPVDNPSSLTVVARASGGSLTLEQNISGSWTAIGSWPLSSSGAEYTHTFTNAGSAAALRFVAGSKATYIHDVTVSGASASYASLSGYPKQVMATSCTVSNLSPATAYAARVCSSNTAGASAWSDWATATTLAGLSAPSWSAIPAQSYRFGSNTGVFEFNVASYASGSPAPAFYLGDTALTAYVDDATGDFVFEPAALGTFSFTVIASNSLGTASTTLSVTVDAIAPELDAIGDRSGTLGSNVEFPVSATGDPAPVFSVTSTDADEVVVVDQDGTNFFLFIPDAIGTYHFTVTATNIAGSDSEIFTVTVTDAPVTVPTLTVSDVDSTSATASWTACDGVSSYTLQLASDDQFTTGGGSGGGESVELVKEGFDNGTTLPTGWTVESGSISGTYTSSGNYGSSSPSLQFKSTVTLSTPVLSNPTNVSFWCKGQGSGLTSTLEIQQLLGGTWTNVDTLTIPGTVTTFSYSLDSSSTQVRFIFTKASGNLAFDDVLITGTSGSSGSSGGSLISTDTVSGLTHTFTGLTPETTYYARVKGTSDWSNVETFTTLAAADSAPVWSAIPAQNYLFGSNTGTFEFNVAPYASGTPSPAFYLDDTPWTAYVDDANGDFIFEPESLGTFDFTIIASNTLGTANATLSVAVTAAPPAFVDLPATVSGTTDGDVTFTVTASGNPAPVLDVAADETLLYTFDDSTGEFRFYSDVTGDFVFSFTASNIAAVVTQSVTVTISPAPVTVPTLAVTNVTDTTALASWTACDGVSAYTLQLSTNAFPAASSATRSLTPILSEEFSGFTANDSTDISGSLNNYTTNSGWTGSKVYCHSREAKVGASSGQAWLTTPSLTVSGSLTVVWEARTYGSSDKYTLLLGISEDGTTFTDTTITLYDDMTVYTNEFTVSGTTAYVRWMNSGTSKARFYLDNVAITSASSGGGDDPGGDAVQTFTVTGTSYTFTDLTPDTAYLARVKGTAGWSETVSFQTLGSSDTAPAIDPIADQTYTYGDNNGIFTLAVTASGTPAPTFSVASSDAPEGSFDIGQNDGEFLFEPAAVGTFHFTVTAANGVSPNATASFAVTVTGTAPTLAAIADQTVAVEEGQHTVPLTVTGNPAPTVTVASADAPDDSFCIDSNGDFYFLFDDATGTFHFTITAANGVSPNATQSFTVTVTGGDTPVEPLEIVFDDFSATASSFTVQGATPGQSYDFLWTADLLVPGFTTNTVVATNTTFTVGFPNDGTWFGYVQPAAP